MSREFEICVRITFIVFEEVMARVMMMFGVIMKALPVPPPFRSAEGGGTKVRGAKESPRIRRGARAFVRGEAQEGHVRAHRRVWASTLRSPRPQEDHDGDDEGYIL